MDSAIVDAINDRVSMTDTLYILGDFSFKMTAADARRLRSKIVCKDVHLLRGNHDSLLYRGQDERCRAGQHI